jgi:hypothetical protein
MAWPRSRMQRGRTAAVAKWPRERRFSSGASKSFSQLRRLLLWNAVSLPPPPGQAPGALPRLRGRLQAGGTRYIGYGGTSTRPTLSGWQRKTWGYVGQAVLVVVLEKGGWVAVGWSIAPTANCTPRPRVEGFHRDSPRECRQDIRDATGFLSPPLFPVRALRGRACHGCRS